MNPSFTCTRLAPSPTGSLHLGHARTFLITWWLARSAGARIIFRMEDLDRRRAKPASVQQTYDDLRWLGIDWDDGPAETTTAVEPEGRGNGDEYVQSRRITHYEQALDRLWARRAIYPCTCSRADIAASVAQSAGAPQAGDIEIRYPGTCRPSLDQVAETRSMMSARLQRETCKPVCWRFAAADAKVDFVDAVHGPQAWNVQQDCGDFPVTRFDGTPAYQLAVVVDDAMMGVDMIIRGDDLLSSTPRQMLLGRALDYPEPRYAHVPLVVGLDGKRLAKRHGESRIAQFREQGVDAATIVGWAAWRSGQIDQPRPMHASELLGRFDLARLPRERVVLTAQDLGLLGRGT